MFDKAADYDAFLRVLGEALDRVPIRLLAYCVMPDHWHLMQWPRTEACVSRFVGWLTLTHTQRWHAHHHTAGSGHLYQGRFKLFPIQEDDHLLTVGRYVERNALRAGLVDRAEAWRWGSLWARGQAEGEAREWLSPWPIPRPASWAEWVNAVQTEAELVALRQSVMRGRPFGDASWVKATAETLNLEATLRPRGRPKSRPPTNET